MKFTIHKGVCSKCNNQRWIVVKKQLCRQCNEENKRKQKKDKPYKIPPLNLSKESRQDRIKIKELLQQQIDEIMKKGKTNKQDKYKKTPIPRLIKIATQYFNAFIRERDKNEGCISCGGMVSQAGHYLSGGHHSEHRFNPDNVHGQDARCNLFLHGNLIEYRKGLIKKIGSERVDKLENAPHNKFKWKRELLIEIIMQYKSPIVT